MIAAVNEQIRSLISVAEERGGEGLVEMQGGTPGMFDDVSQLITYIPSVCLDFLYLHPEKPIVLAGRRTDSQLLNDESPFSRAAPVLDKPNIGAVAAVLTVALEIDEFADARIAMRTLLRRGRTRHVIVSSLRRHRVAHCRPPHEPAEIWRLDTNMETSLL